MYKTLDYSSKDMINFNFSEEGLGLVSPSHFVYEFSRKMFLMLRSIKGMLQPIFCIDINTHIDRS